MKSTSGLTRHLNACTNLLLRIQPNQNTSMLIEDDDASDYFMHHEEEEYPPSNEEQKIRENQKDLIGQILDNKSLRDMLPRHTPQAGLLESELSSSLREVRFSNQEFIASTPVSNIKYNHFGFQNNNPFYPFHDQLDYGQTKYFAESKTTKSNIDKFLFDLLIALLTKKLSYQNTDK